LKTPPNGLGYWRWGGRGEPPPSVKSGGVENCLRCTQNPRRPVHAVLGGPAHDFAWETDKTNNNIIWLATLLSKLE